MEENKQESKVVNEVFTKEDIEKNKGMAIAAYIIWLIPYFGAKDSKFAMYHAKQGLVLFIVAIAGWVLVSLLWNIMSWSMWGFVSLISTIWNVGILVLAVLGIINAAQGEAKELPIIGQYGKKF